MKEKEFYNQKEAISKDIDCIYNLKWTTIKWKDGIGIIFKSIHVGNKLDDKQLEGLLNLMNYGFEKLYIQLDEEEEIIAKMW